MGKTKSTCSAVVLSHLHISTKSGKPDCYRDEFGKRYCAVSKGDLGAVGDHFSRRSNRTTGLASASSLVFSGCKQLVPLSRWGNIQPNITVSPTSREVGSLSFSEKLSALSHTI